VVLRDKPWPALVRTGAQMAQYGSTLALVGGTFAAVDVSCRRCMVLAGVAPLLSSCLLLLSCDAVCWCTCSCVGELLHLCLAAAEAALWGRRVLSIG
jgi:hypothetical protein